MTPKDFTRLNMAPPSSPATTVLSKITVFPDKKQPGLLTKLSVSDLPMLSCHYIQKGLFFPPPPIPFRPLFALLANSLSRALSAFAPLSGRLVTDTLGQVFVSCAAGAGAPFSLAAAPSLTLPILTSPCCDVPPHVKSLFPLDSAVSHDGHFLPLSSFQLTELGDGAVFIGCAVNHAIIDGTSFWNFFNAWAELCRCPALNMISRPPNLCRNYFPDSAAVLRFPDGKPPALAFPVDASLRERIFHFSRESIQELKSKANGYCIPPNEEACGKSVHDRRWKHGNDVSSFQSLCAQLWRSVTRARRQLAASAPTTFRMAVNCRRRIAPAVDERYFGNAIQSIPTTATVGEVAGGELGWIAGMLRQNVAAHGDDVIRRRVAEWEVAPACFPLGNPGGAGLTMGSSPRFAMYEGNDFGWGAPVAVRSGRANKFDGKMSAFPGKEGGGSVDLEVCLLPETMATLLDDAEFMRFVSVGSRAAFASV